QHLPPRRCPEEHHVGLEDPAAQRARRVPERAGAVHLGVPVGCLCGAGRELRQPSGELGVHHQHPLVGQPARGQRIAVLAAHPVEAPVPGDGAVGCRGRVQAGHVLGEHRRGGEQRVAERGEQAVRPARTGGVDLIPAPGRAGPVAATSQVVAHELLVGHGGAGHRIAPAVVRQARPGGHPGTGEDGDGAVGQQGEPGVDLSRRAAAAVVRALHRPPGGQARAAAGGAGALQRRGGGGGEPAADVRRGTGAPGAGTGGGRAGHVPSVGAPPPWTGPAGPGPDPEGQGSGCMPVRRERTSSATSAGGRFPNSDSSPRRESSSPNPTPDAGVTSGGRTTSSCIVRAKSRETISFSSSTDSISVCSSGKAVTPRSILRIFAASGSRSRKSTRVAAGSGFAVWAEIDQYIDALFTIWWSPLVRAGRRSSCSGEPEDSWKVCTWEWNCRWKTARLFPKRPCSTPAAKSSSCSDGVSAAPASTRARAYSRYATIVSWLTRGSSSRGKSCSPLWRAQAPSSAAAVPKESKPTTSAPAACAQSVTWLLISAKSSQVHVVSSGISRPACSRSTGFTPTEKIPMPSGAPTSVPSASLPVSSTASSMALRSSTSATESRSSSEERVP